MTLPLTPRMLEAAYEFLRSTPPFKGWALPANDKVRFRVTRHLDTHGQANGHDDPGPEIDISTAVVGHTYTLMKALAHEMIHIHLDRSGVRAAHGAAFKRCAALVCKRHGFDPKEF